MSSPEAYNVAAAKARADGYSVQNVSLDNDNEQRVSWYYKYYIINYKWVTDYGLMVPPVLESQFQNYYYGYRYWTQGVHMDPGYSIENIPSENGGSDFRPYRCYTPGNNMRAGDLVFFDISDTTSEGSAWGLCRCIGNVSSDITLVSTGGDDRNIVACNNGSGNFCRVHTYPWPSGANGGTIPIKYIVASSDVLPSYPSGYGLQLRDSAGGITFDSRSEILPVIGHYKITSAQIADMFEHYGNFVDIPLPKALTNGCYVCVPYLNAYSERRRPNADGFVRVRPWIRQINATTIRVSAFAQSTNYTGVQGKEYTHDILLIVARPPSEQ